MIIKATTLYNGYTKTHDQYIHINGNTIEKITSESSSFDFEGIVTPAFIDPHSHIGMFREGEPAEQAEGNDISEQIQPLNEPIQSIYMDDMAFAHAVDFGVLYSCIVPGSGNVIGGKTTIIRHAAHDVNAAFVRSLGYKMAIGYNPTSTKHWKGVRPNTRMGVNAMLESCFDTLLLKYEEAKSKKTVAQAELEQVEDETLRQLKSRQIEHTFNAAFSAKEHALLDLLHGDKLIKVHVHKEDDIIYLLHLVKKYNLRVSAEHCLDVHTTSSFKLLKEHNITAIFGPLGSVGYKVELKNYSYKNVTPLVESGVQCAVMSDHPVVHAHTLKDASQYFMIAGMSELEAINLLTLANAKSIELDDVLGSIEENKWASLLIWEKEPMRVGSIPNIIIAEGEVIRS